MFAALLAVLALLVGWGIYRRLTQLVQLTAAMQNDLARLPGASGATAASAAEDGDNNSPPIGPLRNLAQLRSAFLAAESPRLWRTPVQPKE